MTASGLAPVIACSFGTSASFDVVSCTKMTPSRLSVMTSGSFGSLIGGAWVCGRSTGTPTVKQRRRHHEDDEQHQHDVDSGVTLISDIGGTRPRAGRCRDAPAIDGEAISTVSRRADATGWR
jgi:hypothetical protein